MEAIPVNLAEWDAHTYDRVSVPQQAWGEKVLDRLLLVGTETVVDAGCGSGRLTAGLLQRLPGGYVIAIDRSRNMLQQAADNLIPHFGDRVTFVQADIQSLVLQSSVDAIFSTATFHWIQDHQRLFDHLFHALKPGGRLVAQCGGAGNIARLQERAATLLDSPPYRGDSSGWTNPWEFALPEATEARLEAAGFIDIQTSLEAAPTTFPHAAAYREFVQSVVLRAHLAAIPDDRTRLTFMDTIAAQAESDDPPYTLDYWRLNLAATRPQST